MNEPGAVDPVHVGDGYAYLPEPVLYMSTFLADLDELASSANLTQRHDPDKDRILRNRINPFNDKALGSKVCELGRKECWYPVGSRSQIQGTGSGWIATYVDLSAAQGSEQFGKSFFRTD